MEFLQVSGMTRVFLDTRPEEMSERTLVCLANEQVDKLFSSRLKKSPSIRIARRRNRSCLRISFANNKLKLILSRLRNAEHCDRTFFNLKFYGCTLTGFAMEFFK